MPELAAHGFACRGEVSEQPGTITVRRRFEAPLGTRPSEAHEDLRQVVRACAALSEAALILARAPDALPR